MSQANLAKKIRVLLIEENRLLCEGLTAMLNRLPDFSVVAALRTGDDVPQQVQKLTPDVVLIDLGLRSHSSLHVIASIKQSCPDVKVVTTGLLSTQADIIEFIRAGVSGFLLKEATFKELLKTIRLVAEGTHVLPQPLTGSLFSQIVNRGSRREQLLLTSDVRLTRREREIMELIAEGLSNKEVAQRLNVATFTVKSHVHSLLEKLALRSRLQVASYYTQALRKVGVRTD